MKRFLAKRAWPSFRFSSLACASSTRDGGARVGPPLRGCATSSTTGRSSSSELDALSVSLSELSSSCVTSWMTTASSSESEAARATVASAMT